MIARALVVVALLTWAGCASHKTYRLVDQILIPPGVGAPRVARRTLSVDAASGRVACSPASGVVGILASKPRMRVTVQPETLVRQPPGWLSLWTNQLESQGCLAPGGGRTLADAIVESLPLDSKAAFSLLFASPADISPRVQLQVVSPILRDGTPAGAPVLEPVQTSESAGGLNVAVRSTTNLIGYETSSYAVRPKAEGIGFVIAPLQAERHIGGETEHHPQPATNYFSFAPEAAFYQLFFKAEQSEYKALVIAARTPGELERRIKTLESGTASCEKLNGELCVTIPKLVAVTAVLAVTLNGSQTWVRLGATVDEAVRIGGVRNASTVLPQLKVYKPYRGRPAAVEFDRASPAILKLFLTGGETISWR